MYSVEFASMRSKTVIIYMLGEECSYHLKQTNCLDFFAHDLLITVTL